MQIFFLGLYFKHCLIFLAGNRLKFHIVEMLKTKSEQELGWFSDTESACSAWPSPSCSALCSGKHFGFPEYQQIPLNSTKPQNCVLLNTNDAVQHFLKSFSLLDLRVLFKGGQYHEWEPESPELCNSLLTHCCKGLCPGMSFWSLFF